MPTLTRRALLGAYDAGYELAPRLARTRGRGVTPGDCKDIDCVFAECGDPRVRGWTEGHAGFWRIFQEFRIGFRDYLNNMGDAGTELAALIKTDDPDWLLGPEPVE